MPKQNILVIIADDLGVDALRISGNTATAQVGGPAGAQAPAPLSTLGHMLQSGIHFSRGWAHPVCSPTRASLFTGLNPWKTQVGYPGTRSLPDRDSTPAQAPMPMLAKSLKASGYRCGIFGKWDLGGAEGLGGKTPIDWGWDHFEGIYGGGVRPVGVQDYGMPASTLRVNLQGLRDTEELTRKAKRDAAVVQCKDYLSRVCDPRFVEGQPDLRYYIWEKNIDDAATNTRVVDTAPFQRPHLYATADTIESTKAWIRQQPQEQPWCAFVTFIIPHDPYHVPPQGTYKINLPDAPTPQQMFIAMIESMDYYMGQLLNDPTLAEQLKNTVIVFAGDNGTQDRDADTGVQLDGIAKDDKNTHKIGGVHVPMIVSDGGAYLGGAPCYLKDGTGKPTTGTSTANIVHIMDVFKTALDIAGAPATAETDSVTMSGHLQYSGGGRSYVFSQQYPRGVEEDGTINKNSSISDGTYKLSCYRTGYVDGGPGDSLTYEFSSLTPDPNIPGSMQEIIIPLDSPEYRGKIQELYVELVKQRMDSGEPTLPTPRGPQAFPALAVATGASGAPTYRHVRLVAKSEANGGPWASLSNLEVLSNDQKLDRTGWVVTTNSEETVGENGAAKNAIDGSTGSIWHTQWSSSTPQHPHWLQVDMLVPKRVTGFRCLPRQNGPNGRIADYEFWGSNDGNAWTRIASGRFPNTGDEQSVQAWKRLWAIQTNGVWTRHAPELERWDGYSEVRQVVVADPDTPEACYFINPDGTVNWRNVDRNINKSLPGIYAKAISVGANGRVWAIQTNGVWARHAPEYNRWDVYSESRLDIAADPRDTSSCYFINPDYSVQWRNVDANQNVSFPGVQAKRLSAGPENSLWVITTNQKIAHWNSGRGAWDVFEVAASDIAADPLIRDACFYVGSDGVVQWRNFLTGTSRSFPGIAAKAITVT